MRRIIIAAVAAAVLLLCGASFEAKSQDFSSLLNTVSGVVSGASSGQKAGAALNALYKQYKADGKLNMSNVSNIANVTILANSIKGLKGQKLSSTFCKDFATGLVTGSNSRISTGSSASVTKALSKLAGNKAMTELANKAASTSNKAAGTIENASAIASSVTNILKMMQ